MKAQCSRKSEKAKGRRTRRRRSRDKNIVPEEAKEKIVLDILR